MVGSPQFKDPGSFHCVALLFPSASMPMPLVGRTGRSGWRRHRRFPRARKGCTSLHPLAFATRNSKGV